MNENCHLNTKRYKIEIIFYLFKISRDPTYLKIVGKFEDNRKSPFSIHQIAMMGDSEDKRIGEWYGPNTVAQVLK